MNNDKELSAIYKALNHLKDASESVKEARALFVKGKFKYNAQEMDALSEDIHTTAWKLFKQSEAILKK